MHLITMSYSPHFGTPMKPIKSCHIDLILLLATLVRVSAFILLYLTRLTVSRLRITARMLPILRLNLMLPLRLQGLGTCCWLDFTRWDLRPLDYVHRTSARRVDRARLSHPSSSVFIYRPLTEPYVPY